MAIGTRIRVFFHEDATGTAVLDKVEWTPFTHGSELVAVAKSVVKEDFAGTVNDSFVMQYAYPEGAAPADTTTAATFLSTAVADAEVILGNTIGISTP